MFGPVLKPEGEQRLVYSTSTGFRGVCLGSGIILLLIVLGEADGMISFRENLIALSISGLCLISAMFQERWIFDRESNVFERHLGTVFLYSRLKRRLDSLKCVSINEFAKDSSASNDNRRLILTRRTVSLSVLGENNEIHKLDMAKGSGINELVKTAQELSSFCDIPLVDEFSKVTPEE